MKTEIKELAYKNGLWMLLPWLSTFSDEVAGIIINDGIVSLPKTDYISLLSVEDGDFSPRDFGLWLAYYGPELGPDRIITSSRDIMIILQNMQPVQMETYESLSNSDLADEHLVTMMVNILMCQTEAQLKVCAKYLAEEFEWSHSVWDEQLEIAENYWIEKSNVVEPDNYIDPIKGWMLALGCNKYFAEKVAKMKGVA